ncbi:unnamed protein product [Protopolystoma xenopodis]|uniref:Uncharacterized protein n=1 Tax=Protopolystoma xenopodis TaxID=117903 RepID=A0A3S5BN91_9PLAT|nr:unnamed protein product [Protopolystoma xenopodis]
MQQHQLQLQVQQQMQQHQQHPQLPLQPQSQANHHHPHSSLMSTSNLHQGQQQQQHQALDRDQDRSTSQKSIGMTNGRTSPVFSINCSASNAVISSVPTSAGTGIGLTSSPGSLVGAHSLSVSQTSGFPGPAGRLSATASSPGTGHFPSTPGLAGPVDSPYQAAHFTQTHQQHMSPRPGNANPPNPNQSSPHALPHTGSHPHTHFQHQSAGQLLASPHAQASPLGPGGPGGHNVGTPRSVSSTSGAASPMSLPQVGHQQQVVSCFFAVAS